MSSRGESTGRRIRDGTAQRDRLPGALADGYIRPDEMTVADLVTLTARLADNLRFEPRKGSGRFRTSRADGSGGDDWSDLYAGQPVVVLAEMVSLDVPTERVRLQGLGEVDERARAVNHLGEQLLHWSHSLGRRGGPELEELHATLQAAVQQLEDLWAPNLGADGRPEPVWRPFAESRSESAAVLRAPTGSDEERLAALAHAGDRILGLVAEIQEECREQLDLLMRAQGHEPSLALSLAFLQLFRRAQRAMNSFARRRLEFYYLDVLGFAPLPRHPDEVHLALFPVPGVRELQVPGGTGFSAGRDEENRDIVFRSDRALRVTDARVAAVRALFAQRDGMVSPERELGFITGIHVRQADPVVGEEDLTGTVPLFRSPGGSNEAATPALGFAVASPTLHLTEGTRTLRMDFRLRPGPDPSPAKGRAEGDRDEATLEQCYRELGEIFTRELLSSTPLRPEDRTRREEAVARVVERLDPDDDSARVVQELFRRDRRALFQDLFRRALQVSHTAPEGWQTVASPFVSTLDEGVGFQAVLELGPGAKPVVPYDPAIHGAGYATSLPVLRFRIRPDAQFFPYSILRCLELDRVDLEATVRGATDLVVFNKLGPVDASRPFQPFGPLPDRNAAFAFASYQAARKRLVKAWLEVEWGGLPRLPGGWHTHYLQYDQDYSGHPFQVDLSVLRDRRLWPLDPGRRPQAPLFERGPEDRLRPEVTIPLNVLDHFEPLSPTVGEADFRRDPRQRNGVFQISLTPSRTDFGHGAYAEVLTRAVQAAARSKKPVPQPNAPYTPVIDRMTLNYVARSSITVGSEPELGDAGDMQEKIFHDHPFGSFDLGSAFSDERFPLMPGGPGAASDTRPGARHGYDGYLYLGLEASRLEGRLSLLVQAVRSAPAEIAEAGRPVWYYLASNRWHRFSPLQVVDDSTHGFQRTGLVTLDIPGDIDTDNTILPGGLYWLAVGFDELASAAFRLHSIATGGVRVVWDAREEGRSNPGIAIPPGTIQAPVEQIPGLERVLQVGPSSGGRPAEDFERLATRASERLRHKGRAVTPWDYEHLVLERFPDVSKAKCLPNTEIQSYPDEARGQVLMVVVPRLRPPSTDRWRPEFFSGLELEEIRRELQGVAPASARVTVRNPVYEELQVRCRVKLRGGVRKGQRLDRINRALVDHLAPWRAEGRGGRFGWVVREKDVAALLYGLPFVDFVTDVSLLHVSEDKNRPGDYYRRDTARVFEPSARPYLSPTAVRRRSTGPGAPWVRVQTSTMDREVSARYPWSLAVPRPTHFVHALSDVEAFEPHITGVGELEIGRDFILEPDGE